MIGATQCVKSSQTQGARHSGSYLTAVLAQEHGEHGAEDLHHGQLQLIRDAQGDGHGLREPESTEMTGAGILLFKALAS